jgi:hypothetical protein
MMKHSNFIIAIALLSALPAWAQNPIVSFTAQAENDDYVVLEWNSGSEAGLSLFRVERSLDGLTFLNIAEISPQGDNSAYRYEDHDLYKTTPRTYYYRVRAVMMNGTSSTSPVQSVTLAFSGVQQTWGSIKALFR